MSPWLHITLQTLLLLLHCHSSCHSTIAPAVDLIVYGSHLKRQNQGNGFYLWLSGACVFLLIANFDIRYKIQGGNLITLFSSIEESELNLSLHVTLPTLLLLLHCHSSCHSIVGPAVTWIVQDRGLKWQNQGNGFYQWMSGACASWS